MSDEIRDLFEVWVKTGSAAGDCPPAEAIWEAAHGERAPESVLMLADHTSACASCASDWAMAVEVQRSMPADEVDNVVSLDKSSPKAELDKSSPKEALDKSLPMEARVGGEVVSLGDGPSFRTERRPTSRTWTTLGGLALAAAALFAMVSTIPQDDVEPVYRDGGARIELLTPEKAELPREAVRITWTAEPGWTYDVLVSNDALEAVHTAYGIEGGALTLPAKATAELPAGTMLLWRVEGLGPDGSRRTSKTAVVQLK